ncbi:hypothetical protein BDM02DRAFT_3111088 [Thelephora ganbajun]|uniref:Uncharacterized protein n=1 Tax=Thelephora ganbajun TaxID=370292 RepID=A0ACB6ZNC1_THEGA|nr:hypothetical protein BDM02DRAFT_3111088 [Thelephora ganbajun]
MLHCPSSETPELDAKLVLSAPPAFIILHDVSSLFENPELEATCPDYLRVIAQAADAANSLSNTPERDVNLVWFDSKLHNLTLPALPRPNYVNEADEKYYEQISVGKMAEKYFEWVGDVSVGERTLRFVYHSGVPVLNENPVAGEEMQLEVKVRGPGNSKTSWKWESRE